MATTRVDEQSSLSVEKVRIDGVTKRFADVVAVDDVSFSIEEQEFLTLWVQVEREKYVARTDCGFIQPSEGEIYIDDEPISTKAPYERSIGMVFQGWRFSRT